MTNVEIIIVVAGYYAMPPMFLRAVGGISASYQGRTVTLQTVFDTTANTISSGLAEQGIGSIGEYFGKALKEIQEETFQEMADELYLGGAISDFWHSMY